MIGDFIRSSGTHIATKSVQKSGRAYSKANRQIKARLKQIAKRPKPKKGHFKIIK